MASGRAPALQAMLQTLLVERFKVVVHREMKQLPVYMLTAAKGGPKLTPSKEDDKRKLLVSGDPTGKILDRTLRGTKASMASLIYLLGPPNVTDRPVIDRTGITGEFNFEVKFAPVDNNAFGSTSSAALNPRSEDAMVYKNLLPREKAGLAADPQEKTRLSALADDWFNRALETRKANAQTGAAGISQPGAIPPPPLPPTNR